MRKNSKEESKFELLLKLLEQASKHNYNNFVEAQQLAHTKSWDNKLIEKMRHWSEEIINIITEFKKTLIHERERLIKINRQFEVLVENSNDIIGIISSDGIIKYISPAIAKVMGFKTNERIGKYAFELLDESEKKKLINMLIEIRDIPDKAVYGDIKAKTATNNEIYVELTLKNQLSEPAIEGIIVNARDITQRVECQKRITHFATHDELTDLPNRNHFIVKIMEMCEKAVENQMTFALMLVDVNGLKDVNDVLGCDTSDNLIIKITKRLKDHLGSEAFISCYSSDQFAIIIPSLSSYNEYKKRVNDIIALFSQDFKVGKYYLTINVSIGVSVFPKDGRNADAIMKSSNIALFRAKQEGKNKYAFYSSNIDTVNYKQFTLRNDLLKSIEKNQLRVYYQPLINLKSNEILGAEALIRWEHPDWGMISPYEFISLAEETGFIIRLGKWMLREVCKNYRNWQDQGLKKIKVSVNYSTIQLLENNFVENIINIINEFNLDPRFLIIEITESVLMKYPENALSNIRQLQKVGIEVALDDFGTGYSSLSYLSSLNIDIVKIDRSFVQGAVTNETYDVVTQTIIKLVRELCIKICAEGVENWAQLYYLRNLSCDTGQGFLYSKPVPLFEFETMLKKGICYPLL